MLSAQTYVMQLCCLHYTFLLLHIIPVSAHDSSSERPSLSEAKPIVLYPILLFHFFMALPAICNSYSHNICGP